MTVGIGCCFWGIVMAERLYELSPVERDRLIVKLRAQNWTLEQIARRVGMSRGGVSRALERIKNGD